MKTTLLLSALVVNGFAALPVAQPVTPAALAKLQQMDPMAHLEKPVAGQAIVARPQNQSIIKQSIILHDAYHWTFVPSGAVIFLPPTLKERITDKPVGTLVPWSEFLAKNYSWITTQDVSIAQAAGKEPLPPELSAFWTKQDKLVVAVFQRGPISLRVPEPTTTPKNP